MGSYRAGSGRGAGLNEFNFPRVFDLDPAYFVGSLQVQPELFGRPEETREPYGCVSANTSPFEDNVIDSGWWNAQPLRQFVRGNT
jgi:hypothetical protein